MNILIVEDDTAIREGVAEFLKENEYEVFCAGDGHLRACFLPSNFVTNYNYNFENSKAVIA